MSSTSPQPHAGGGQPAGDSAPAAGGFTRPMSGRVLHMMGIGGAGVSGLARLCAAWGAEVSGCDRAASAYSDAVQAAGIPVELHHDAGHVTPGSELVVSSAVAQDNAELARARELNIPVLLRGELLGQCTERVRSVVIAGAHGKSTTAAMIAHAAAADQLAATALIGAEVPSLGGNTWISGDDWLILEGDESDRTLLHLRPQIAVVTNLERDHHHTFATDEELFELFERWVGTIPPDGTLVLGPGAELDRLAKSTQAEVVRVSDGEESLAALRSRLSVPGRHNALNALVALAALEAMGVPRDRAVEALQGFGGVARRFELVGASGEISVVDDYAHHPTEVAATIAAARDRYKRVVVIFQPHLYSRTQALWHEFATALAGADTVFVCDIYPAREEPLPGVTAGLIADAVQDSHPQRYGGLLEGTSHDLDVEPVIRALQAGDVAITMGAGDITTVAPRLLARIRESEAAPGAPRGTAPATARGRVPATARGRAPGESASPEPEPWMERNVALSRFTTIGTGGAAAYFARVDSEQRLHEALQWASRHGMPIAVIGLGSNTLIADEGFSGLALRLVDELARIEIDPDHHQVTCGGGASLAAIVRLCRDAGLTGFEFGCAIPGTVGGAVKMNAGAYGGEMVQVLECARVCTADGVRDVRPEELDLRYRHSNLTAREIVSEATLQLSPGDPAQIKQRIKDMQARRSTSQPRAARSFGSVFQNPHQVGAAANGPGAGALIEAAGLKGHTIGGARISPKHGNFIENLGEASTRDIVALIRLARERVLKDAGVELRTEVHLLDHNGYRPLFDSEEPDAAKAADTRALQQEPSVT